MNNVTHTDMSAKFLLIGDYNLPGIQWTDSEDDFHGQIVNNDGAAIGLTETLDFCGLSQVNRVKNQNNVILDLVLSNVQPDYIKVNASSTSLVNEDLHHPTLQIILDTKVSYQNEKKFRFLNFLKSVV